jgi:hypothetical protein
MTKIAQLVDIGANLAAGDEFIIRDVSDASTPNKKVTSSGFIDYIIAQGTGAGFTQIAAGVGPLARALATSSGATGTLTFSTAAATTLIERARIDSSGRLLVGTSTANTSGAKLQTSDGLTFPATQVASADPNTLDDYEEGTWTPVAGGNATDGTATYAIQNGTYTKVGRMVTIHANLSWSSCTATGNMRLRGLPFTSAATIASSVDFGYQENITLAAFAILNGFVNPSQTFIIPQSTVTGGATSTEIAVDAAAVIYFSATYFVS